MAAPMCRRNCRLKRLFIQQWKRNIGLNNFCRLFSFHRTTIRHKAIASYGILSPERRFPPEWQGLRADGLPSGGQKCVGCSAVKLGRSVLAQPFHHTTANHRSLVLGIETSCDDTGAAVVDDDGRIIGEALNSQTKLHVQLGGIIPPIARDLHKQNIEEVVNLALQRANITLQEVDAIATTVKPGLSLSLLVGLNYARKLVHTSGKPFIPIHHMEAHALTARMIEKVEFPFLVLLISGGHCLLAVVRNVEDFLLLGKGLDDAPGDAFDKTARELRLKNLADYSEMSGGQAIEQLSRQGNPRAFSLINVMAGSPDCNFSFAGLKEAMRRIIREEEKKHRTGAVEMLPNIADICASFQYFVTHHLAKRLQRALLFCEMKNLLPLEKTVVVSGGVASNMFIRQGLQQICDQYNCRLVCPPPKLCTDNGIMIAWNGMEKWKLGLGAANPQEVDIQPKCPLGEDITDEVKACSIKLSRIKLL